MVAIHQLHLVGVSKTTHTTHDAKDIVVGSVDADLSGLGTRDGSSRDNELKSGVVNSGKVASSRGLVLLRAKGEGVDVDTSVGVSGVVLEGLNEVEVGTLALGEAILSVKLELSGNNRVLTPAVHLAGSLGKNESTGIRDTIVFALGECSVKISDSGRSISVLISSGVIEKTRGIDDRVVRAISTELTGTGESADGVGKSINSIGVVERLSAKSSVKNLTADERVAVAYVGIRLNDPDKLLVGWLKLSLILLLEEPMDSSPVN